MQNEVKNEGLNMCVKFKFYFYLFSYAKLFVVVQKIAMPHKLLMLFLPFLFTSSCLHVYESENFIFPQ